MTPDTNLSMELATVTLTPYRDAVGFIVDEFWGVHTRGDWLPVSVDVELTPSQARTVAAWLLDQAAEQEGPQS